MTTRMSMIINRFCGALLPGALVLVLLMLSTGLAQTILAPPSWIGIHEDRGGINLRWFRVQGATSYIVERRDGEKGDFSRVGKVNNPVYDDFNVSPGQTYFYRIIPLDKNQQLGSVSEERYFFLEKGEAGVVAPPVWGSHHIRESGIALSWSHEDSEQVLAYNLYRKKEGQGTFSLLTSTVDSTYLDRDVVEGTSYIYVVTALSGKLQESNYSTVSKIVFARREMTDVSNSRLVALKTLEEVVQRTTLIREYSWQDYDFVSPVDVDYEKAEERLLVSDSGTGYITVISASGDMLFRLGGQGTERWQFERLLGIAVDKYGTIYGVDAYAGDIVIFSSRGNYEKRISLKQQVYTYFGASFLTKYPWFRFGISDILITDEGWMVIVDNPNGWLYILDAGGNLSRVIGRKGAEEGQFHYPTFLARDGKGRLVVADTLNSRVQLVDLDGNYSGTIGSKGLGVGQFLRPKGIALGLDGLFYVADSQHNVIQVFDENLEFVALLGNERGLPIDLGSPNGIVFHEPDLLFVAERLSRRVQVLSLAPLADGEDVQTGPAGGNPVK